MSFRAEGKFFEFLLGYAPSCSLKPGKHKIYEDNFRLIGDIVSAHISCLIHFVSCPVERSHLKHMMLNVILEI
jgi:hypothetical protein